MERKDYTFFVELDYENIPDFCNHCMKIGHHVGNCKNLIAFNVKETEEIPKAIIPKPFR